MKVTARVTRAGTWWAVEVPEVGGAYTQAKRLEQVASMVRDAVALLTDALAESVEVELEIELDDTVASGLASARMYRTESERLAREASEKFSEIARTLVESGMPFRDVGVVLGVSHQRVGQLVASARTST